MDLQPRGGGGALRGTAPAGTVLAASGLDPARLLAEVRQRTVAIPGGDHAWLAGLVDDVLARPLEPFALLPLCTGIACGGEADALAPVAAAAVAAALALRVLDDCADDDAPGALHRRVGTGRAVNAAAALATAAVGALRRLDLPAGRRDRLLDEHQAAFLRVCRGQERQMAGQVASLVDARAVGEDKTVAAFAFAAVAGALAATDDEAAHERCRRCGESIGWMTQILDDLEALWLPDEPDRLETERTSLPVLFGLALEDPRAARLRSLFEAGEPVRALRPVLDELGVRRRLMASALDCRDGALAALGPPLRPAGRALLELWLDWAFADARRLAGAEPAG